MTACSALYILWTTAASWQILFHGQTKVSGLYASWSVNHDRLQMQKKVWKAPKSECTWAHTAATLPYPWTSELELGTILSPFLRKVLIQVIAHI